MDRLPPLRIYRGHTVHKRSTPFEHRFKYDLLMIDLDVDRLQEADHQSVLFSIDKPNLFSFRAKDHGASQAQSLGQWARAQFETLGLKEVISSIRLLTFPRHLFYKFAPISIWIGYDADDTPAAILYEVHNTFGERHTYAASIPGAGRQQHEAEKAFHVSPFFDISGRYRFTLNLSENKFGLTIETLQDSVQTHMASLHARAYNASTSKFLRLAALMPFSSLGVTFAIHWQALKLWLKGAVYHKRPQLPVDTVTVAKAPSGPSNQGTTA